MAKKPATVARKIMASAPAVIGLVRKFAGDQFADHVADCLIPLDGAARARQGTNMVADPSEKIVTNPARSGVIVSGRETVVPNLPARRGPDWVS
jgi:hypothetical protein